ncbi:UNVERIFIED_CONTAM: hypothetical protein K2H54_024440 [Gekko kuhli]
MFTFGLTVVRHATVYAESEHVQYFAHTQRQHACLPVALGECQGQNREEERPSVLEAELSQHPFVTVTANKPVIGLNAGTKAEAIGKVEIEKEESEISLQLPASKQTSADIGSASSEEKKLTQNTYLLEFVSGEMKPVSVAETSTDTLVEQTVTVEANRVEIEKSKENVSDPSKENPEKLQIESFLLEDVEAKESKESRAQITMLKVDSALQKEREEIDLVVTETNVDPKKDNDFTNECQLCQFDTDTVTMIEQLVDQRPRKAQLGKHFPDRQGIDEPLSQTGFRQASAAGVFLSNVRFTHVFSSDLLRAKQTAASILRKSKFSKEIAVKYDARLRERKYGVAEGRPLSDLRTMAKAAGEQCPSFTPPGGETLEEVQYYIAS